MNDPCCRDTLSCFSDGLTVAPSRSGLRRGWFRLVLILLAPKDLADRLHDLLAAKVHGLNWTYPGVGATTAVTSPTTSTGALPEAIVVAVIAYTATVAIPIVTLAYAVADGVAAGTPGSFCWFCRHVLQVMVVRS
jgi:hypothetical protein